MFLYRNLIAVITATVVLCGCQRHVAPEVPVDVALAKELRAKLRLPAAAASSDTGASSGDAGAPAAQAAGWGNLSGTFKVDGTPPAPEKIPITTDAAVCGKFGLVNESVVVGSGGGLANVVIYIRPKGTQKIPISPEYGEPAAKKMEIDNKNCRFEPHVIAIRTQQALVIGNPDPMGHNSKGSPQSNPPFNPVLPAGGNFQYVFNKSETMPVPLQCNIHSWMQGWIVVRDDPYVAISDKDGKFEIKNLPAGEWEFQVWQEKLGGVEAVTLDGKAAKWPKGRFTRKIAPGDNALGDIVIAASALK
jgi:hypothetical protein